MSYPASVLPELHFVGVADPGVPNYERIVLRPTQDVELLGYGVALGIGSLEFGAKPVFDNCFWFPSGVVAPPSWVLIYTGRGTPQILEDRGETLHTFHWQRPYTLFTRHDLVPILFRLDSALVGRVLRE